MFIRNIPSIITVSGIHPGFTVVESIGGLAFSYLFCSTVVMLDFVPFVGVPSMLAIALGSSMHCSNIVLSCCPVLVIYATLFFQHSICNFLSLSTSDPFFFVYGKRALAVDGKE